MDDDARNEIHSRMTRLIPRKKVLPLTPSVLGRASQLAKIARWRVSYFGTLIVSTGLENDAESAISTDHGFVQLRLEAMF